MNWLLNFFLRNSYFPQVQNAELELKKAALLRIFLGGVIFTRFSEIIFSLTIYYDFSEYTWPSLYLLTLIFLFTIGFFSPVVTLLLMGSLRWFDTLAGTNNLGTIILINTLLLFVLINQGSYYSIDNLILKGRGIFSKVLRNVYSWFGTPAEEDITKAYLMAFLIYAIISFGALLFHIQDEHWVGGLTIKSLLTSSYLSKHYLVFRAFENSFPMLLGIISISGGVLQSIFQFLMIPLLFLKYGQRFAMLWGLNFILVSLFFINLSYLPHIELILWLLIFFPLRTQTEKLEIIFDDYCNLCKRTISVLKFLNFNGRYQFSPLSKNKEKIIGHDVSEDEVKTIMVAFYKQKLIKGYDVYLKLSLLNPLLWVFIPLLYLAKIAQIGPSIYRFIAERRYKLFGQCELSYNDKIQSNHNLFVGNYRTGFFSWVYNIYGVLLIGLIVFVFPFISTVVKGSDLFKESSFPRNFKYAAEKIGLHVPFVFNKTDLSMGDHWMLLYRMGRNQQWELVPITAPDGSRLNYMGFDILQFSNHNTDFLYFGCTLQYGRYILETNDITSFHEGPEQLGRKNVEKRITYDFRYNGFKEPTEYRIEVFSSKSSDLSLFESDSDRHKPTLIYSKSFSFDGHTLSDLLSKQN